ncbi:MAG: hypothetical protein JW814_02855 [Candidatus Krumholzibacteriota bacterium]|nr:hypothetical protein [Candidatus Krumholzibacteriota bacterium]
MFFSIKKEILILLAVTALAIFFYGEIDYKSAPFSGMDLKYYREMAAASPSLAESIPSPWGNRILGPWLAGLAENDITGFKSLTIFLSILLVLTFYNLLVFLGIGRKTAVVSSILFIFSKHFFGMTAWNFFQVKDLISLVCLTAGILLMYRKRWISLGAVLLAGSFSGELTLVMIPVLFIWLLERGGFSKNWKAPAMACLPGDTVKCCV